MTMALSSVFGVIGLEEIENPDSLYQIYTTKIDLLNARKLCYPILLDRLSKLEFSNKKLWLEKA
jgi:hypothetical protein